MDELDQITMRLKARLNRGEGEEEEEADDFDVEREEEPMEEQKFQSINNTPLSPIQELAELQTTKQMSFSEGLNEEEPEPIKPEFATTMQTDAQRATLQAEMRQT